jgi:hypothetical protein
MSLLALKNHEFEGALAILRFWLPLFADSMLDFYGYLSEQKAGEEEASRSGCCSSMMSRSSAWQKK